MFDLQSLREEIDGIDLKIVKLLARRYKLTKKVGEYKAKNNLPAVDKSRESLQKEKFAKLSKEYDLDEKTVWKIFKTIIDDVVKNHIKIAKRKNEK